MESSKDQACIRMELTGQRRSTSGAQRKIRWIAPAPCGLLTWEKIRENGYLLPSSTQVLLPSDYLQVGDGICCKWQLRSEKHTFYVFFVHFRSQVSLGVDYESFWTLWQVCGRWQCRDPQVDYCFLVADCETTKWRWQMSPATRSFGGNGVELAMTGVSMA